MAEVDAQGLAAVGRGNMAWVRVLGMWVSNPTSGAAHSLVHANMFHVEQ